MNIFIYYPEEKLSPYYEAAIQEYEKRLSRYCKIKRVPYKTLTELNAKVTETQLSIAVYSKGSAHSSEALAKLIDLTGLQGISEINFIFTLSALPNCQATLSLSQMTLDTALSLTVIYEQIYRAYRIIHQHAYHK